ncbi:hypothetical protein [Lactococcus lactis]|uniref:hypothetical protein n=1 Tax=Lactococcus lactis TaxID=1358 RepID=UPI0023A99BB5|nr:hypothetical protein [Lactococcus lactis]WEA54410.1 hypothetical protein PWP91_08995 [Lactococcus lactis]
MKKILQFIPFFLLVWLCLSFPSFTSNNKQMMDSFNVVVGTLTKLFHSEKAAIITLLFGIPSLSLLFCGNLFLKEKNKKLILVYSVTLIISLASWLIFGMILLIGLGNYM